MPLGRLLSSALLIFAVAACDDRVLPGLAFGPGGRLVEVRPEDLQAEAQRVVEEQMNMLLNDDWYAEAVIIGTPIEDIDRPYKERWYWLSATVQVTLYGRDGTSSPPTGLNELRRIALETMQRATDADEDVTASIKQSILSPPDFERKRPNWLRLLPGRGGA